MFGTSGKFMDQLVFRVRGNQTIISAMPVVRDDWLPMLGRLATRDRFKKAIRYAKGMLKNLLMQRHHHAHGTNGWLSSEDHLLCCTIKLPWRNNRRGLSCIPEGRYPLEARWSPRFKDHLLVEQVPGRQLILIHPANDALSQLKGCIAPVSDLTGPGRGTGSAPAVAALRRLVYRAIEAGERVWLVIAPLPAGSFIHH